MPLSFPSCHTYKRIGVAEIIKICRDMLRHSCSFFLIFNLNVICKLFGVYVMFLQRAQSIVFLLPVHLEPNLRTMCKKP